MLVTTVTGNTFMVQREAGSSSDVTGDADLFVASTNISPITATVCFVRGSLILTEHGERPVETLKAGDWVETADNDSKQILWIEGERLSKAQLQDNPKLLPIKISAGALGSGLPLEDLYVSPQHRVLVSSKIAMRMFGKYEVLVPANKLVGLEGISVVEDCDEVEYYHFVFDQHEIVFSNGAKAESLYTGEWALKSLSDKAIEELMTIFPKLRDPKFTPKPARELVDGKRSKKLVNRHKANQRALVMAH